jgi:phosphoribosyl-ATP pyrophosphohydrolase/phosphoribosyl-AMP cyclohydrolase
VTNNESSLQKLDRVIGERQENPQNRYTDDLLSDRNMRLKKIGEESAELVVACVDKNKISIAEEAADLFYHALVAIRAEGVTLQDVEEILEGRAN